MFNISFFTHTGSIRKDNQDRILVQRDIYSDGLYSLFNQESALCFVADGIGGNAAGNVAAEFVLNEINNRINWQADLNRSELLAIFQQINKDLLDFSHRNTEFRGMGTTLSGFYSDEKKTVIINIGDSQIWVLRKGAFYQLSEDQVFEPQQENSPLVSYFGGYENNLTIQFCDNLREIIPKDILLCTTDGLFKAVKPQQVKAILMNENVSIKYKAEFLLQTALKNSAEDNLGCILAEAI